MDNINLNNLTEDELDALKYILGEYSAYGTSDTLEDILEEDFDDIPVDILTFMTDPDYLGKSLTNSDGKLLVYPYWVEILEDMFGSSDGSPRYSNCALSGAIG